ncbi:hypothetical protein CVT24_012027 [Panaeolus cyanescens]|uniref:Reverse transcriptase domain-containing protein n=1 Tax=Panaeolus cyanescens TaxID=181874 RepID=A0A409YP75_9AGAR|nr:hypothetical protein CVT24_012027 [Panaeolus cyanescens]
MSSVNNTIPNINSIEEFPHLSPPASPTKTTSAPKADGNKSQGDRRTAAQQAMKRKLLLQGAANKKTAKENAMIVDYIETPATPTNRGPASLTPVSDPTQMPNATPTPTLVQATTPTAPDPPQRANTPTTTPRYAATIDEQFEIDEQLAIQYLEQERQRQKEAAKEDIFHLWDEAPGPKLIAYIYGANPTADGLQQTEAIRDVIKQFLPNASPRVQHAPPFRKRIPFEPAAPKLVTNLLEDEKNALLNRRLLVTDRAAVFFQPLFPNPPTPAFCLQNYAAANNAESYLEVAEMVRNCLRRELSEGDFAHFVTIHHDNVGGFDDLPLYDAIEQTFDQLLASVTVKGFTMPTREGYARSIFTVEMFPLTNDHTIHELWLQRLRSIRYYGDYGLAKVRESFNCNHCKAMNHIASTCPFPEIPNFPTPFAKLGIQNAAAGPSKTVAPQTPLSLQSLFPSMATQVKTEDRKSKGPGGRGREGTKGKVATLIPNSPLDYHICSEPFRPGGEAVQHAGRADCLPNDRTKWDQNKRAELSKRPPRESSLQTETQIYNGDTSHQTTEGPLRMEKDTYNQQNTEHSSHNGEDPEGPEGTNPPPDHTISNPKKKKRKRKAHRRPLRTRAYLTISSLNINGGGSRSTQDKWENMNQIIREDKLDILAIQETHITNQKIIELHTRYPRLHIINSSDEERPNARGVAIILNKHRTRWRESNTTEIIPGQAITMTLPWKQNESLNILAIYAPNSDGEQTKFWGNLYAKYQENPHLPRPDIMLGDFNLVEDAMDRNPPHRDPEPVVNIFQNFKLEHNLQDAWRNEYPDDLEFTYMQFQNTTRKSQSRLDRIYVKGDIMGMCYDWHNKHSGIRSDHKLISMKLEDPLAPYIGKGRWAMPHFVIQNKSLMNEIKEIGRKYLTEMKTTVSTRNQDQAQRKNPQEIHEEFKQTIQDKVRTYTRTAVPKLEKLIERKTRELSEILRQAKHEKAKRNQDSTPNEDATNLVDRPEVGTEGNELRKDLIMMAKAAEIEEELLQLHLKLHQRVRDEIRAKFWREAETIGKPWINVNKDVKPRDTIYKLKFKVNGQTKYATKSEDMANKAAEYHNNLQCTDDQVKAEERRSNILNHIEIMEKHLNTEKREYMDREITKNDIQLAIRQLPNGKSPGLDGIITEFYKTLADDLQQDLEKADEDPDQPVFDILEYLQILYKNFALEGPCDTSNFAEGWMCPIYKKNDKTDIANYRPITVLNTDYKIFTRALTTKLGNVVQNIIHTDQAGFMKKRNIADHTDLVHMLTYLCETVNEKGAIICLDQEKAYDKIRHDYLWLILEKFQFPESFIKTIKHLYAKAETLVMINGVPSKKFRVTRGVRQGDPLSCLLFNLAIEPLAEHIRKANIRGINIDHDDEIKVSLFADDTTVYMSEQNDLLDLFTILDSWCGASGAKFNKSKTEIIPLGDMKYREKLRSNRALQEGQQKLPDEIKIAEEGQPTRVLGTWVGYDIDQIAIWNKTIEKITNTLKRWERGHPTQEGRRLILGMYVTGMTQYLTRAQGMEEIPLARCEKIVNTFMWGKEEEDKTHPTIRLSILQEPIQHGGRQDTCWELAEKLMRKRVPNWTKPNLGRMLGQGYKEQKKSKSKKEQGTRRLRTIVTTETMHLIWKLRCEWKIGRSEDPEQKVTKREIINRWHSVINSRLKIDCLLTNRRKYGNKALPRGLVTDTWTRVIETDKEEEDEWVKPGVLVGIAPIEV